MDSVISDVLASISPHLVSRLSQLYHCRSLPLTKTLSLEKSKHLRLVHLFH